MSIKPEIELVCPVCGDHVIEIVSDHIYYECSDKTSELGERNYNSANHCQWQGYTPKEVKNKFKGKE